DLLERPRAVREAGAVPEVDEILVREGDEALVKDGQPAHPGVEDSDRPCVHAADSTRGLERLVVYPLFGAEEHRRRRGRRAGAGGGRERIARNSAVEAGPDPADG